MQYITQQLGTILLQLQKPSTIATNQRPKDEVVACASKHTAAKVKPAKQSYAEALAGTNASDINNTLADLSRPLDQIGAILSVLEIDVRAFFSQIEQKRVARPDTGKWSLL
jgi:hypothetical protein